MHNLYQFSVLVNQETLKSIEGCSGIFTPAIKSWYEPICKNVDNEALL